MAGTLMSVNLLLIGYGKWGKKCEKVISEIKNVNLQIADKSNWKKLIDLKPDGVIICTRPDSHVEISSYSLERRIPTMIEKPLSLSYEDAKKLEIYDDGSVPILVNNLHLFSPAFQKICELVNINDIYKIRSIGLNNGPIIDHVLFDYGSHEFSMGIYLTKIIPQIIRCQESNDKFRLKYNIDCNYGKINHNAIIGNINEIKIRLFEIETNDGTKFIYDDTTDNKLTINGKIYEIRKEKTLENSINKFILSIKGHVDDRFGLKLSFDVIKLLDLCKEAVYNTNF